MNVLTLPPLILVDFFFNINLDWEEKITEHRLVFKPIANEFDLHRLIYYYGLV